MRLFRTARYSLIVIAVLVPFAYVIAAKQGLHTIANTWKTFHDLCIASGYAFANYLFVHDRFASLFMILISSAGLIWSAIYVVRQIYYTKRLKTQLHAKTAVALSGNIGSVMLVKDDRPFALTVGFLKPHIYVSSKLKKILSEKELICVIAHEQHHRSSRDALLALALETLARLLFFLPSFRSLVKHMHLRHELVADQAALQNTSLDILASAIFKSIEYRGAPIAQQSVALGFSTMSERITYLLNPSLKPVLHVSWFSLGWSVGMIFVVLLAAASMKPNDVHAQIISAQGPMTKAVIEHCKTEDFSYLPFSQSLRSEINMSVLFRF